MSSLLPGCYCSQAFSVDRVGAHTHTNVEFILIIQCQSNTITGFIIVFFLSLYLQSLTVRNLAPQSIYQCKQAQSSCMSQVYCSDHHCADTFLIFLRLWQAMHGHCYHLLFSYTLPHLRAATLSTPPVHDFIAFIPAEFFRKETGKWTFLFLFF